MKSLKDLRADSRYLGVNIDGNKKLKNANDTAFIIWNLPAVITCPYATEACKGKCYALKAERVYPTVRPARERNFEATRKPSFVSDMIYTLSIEIERNAKKGKKNIVRIHESGDFYNQNYFDSWVKIAEFFAPIYGDSVVFMAYTKSVKYIAERSQDIPANMCVRYSLWDDTDPKQAELARALGLPVYTAGDPETVKKAVENGATRCDCADCANCGYCWDKSKNTIYCVIH